MSTVLSLSRDQVSARLCPPPGTRARHSPRRGGGSWVRKASSRTPSQFCSPRPTQPDTKLRNSCHVCQELSQHLPGKTGNPSLLGASLSGTNLTLSDPPQKLSKNIRDPPRSLPCVTRSTPSPHLNLYSSPERSPYLQAQTVPTPNKIDLALPPSPRVPQRAMLQNRPRTY